MTDHTHNQATKPPSRFSRKCLKTSLLSLLYHTVRNYSKQDQQGSILIYLVVVIVVASALGAGIVSMTTTSTFTGLSYNPSDQARFLAQAGIDYIKTKPQGFEGFDETVFSLENGEFELTVSKTGGAYEITSIGRVHPGTSREASFKIIGRISEVMLEYLFELADDLGRDTGGNSLHGTAEPGVVRNPKICSSDIPAYTDPLDADQSTCYFASFDGVDSGIPMGAADLEFEDEMTVMAWVRWGMDPSQGTQWANIVTSSDSIVSGDRGQFWLQHNSNNSKFEFAVYTDRPNNPRRHVLSNTSTQEGVWQHVAGVYDGQEIKIYVDGVLENQTALDGNIVSNEDFPALEFQLSIGRWNRPAFRRFTGDIDEVRVFDKALSEEDINAYLTKTRECKIPRLMAEYRFDECTWDGSAGEVIDSSGNNNHGTAMGGATTVTSGRVGRAGSFDANEDQYIEIPHSDDLEMSTGNQVTVAGWIKQNNPPPPSKDWVTLLSKSDKSYALQLDYRNNQGKQGEPRFTIYDGPNSWRSVDANEPIQPGIWYHLAATFDGENVRIYVDGNLQNDQNTASQIISSNLPLYLAHNSGATNENRYFDGMLDEFKIFDKALTSQQIRTLYNNENSGRNCDGTTREAIICNDNGENNDNGNGNDEENADDFITYLIEEDVFVYGSQLSFAGGSVTGHGATVVIQGGLVTSDLGGGSHVNVSNIYIGGDVDLNGGSASLGSDQDPGVIYVDGNMRLWNGSRNIYGDVYVMGNFDLKDARIHGNVYVDGDLTLGWTPWLAPDSYIYYTGARLGNTSGAVLQKCIKVDTLDNAPGYDPGLKMPDQEVPGLRPDSWYAERGYASSGLLVNNMKVFADNYSSTSWRPTASEVVIVSRSDITVTGLGGSGLTGVLFAPYGRVTFGGGFFEGTVIARDGFFVTSGGTNVTFRNIEDFFSSSDDIPIGP